MHGRRGTLQPWRAGRKSPILFAPSRIPIDAIAPAAVSIAESSMSSRSARSPRRQSQSTTTARIFDVGTINSNDYDDDDDSESSSEEEDSEEEPPTSPSSHGSEESAAQKARQQHEYIYFLQDDNADLRKAIHGLEIVLRDHGFDKDGKQVISTDEIVRINDDNDEEGNPKAHMEMVSMMGMDPERPTVLCKYMEFKVSELQDDLDAMETEKQRLTTLVHKLTSDTTQQDTVRIDRLRDSKAQKRKMEDKLTAAILVSKTRDTLLSQKVDGLESKFEASQRQEEILRKRIAELEAEANTESFAQAEAQTEAQAQAQAVLEPKTKKDSVKPVRDELLTNQVQALEFKIDTHTKKESLHKEQITALETNLEWNIEESTKREEVLRGQISALETNLEWTMEESTKREELLRGQSSVEESTKREELLQEQITALETNLEWSIEESTKREDLLRGQIIVEESTKREELLQEQITALQTNLEWSIEESTKREDLLRGQIAGLERRKDDGRSEDSLTQEEFYTVPQEDSLTQEGSFFVAPPDDYFQPLSNCVTSDCRTSLDAFHQSISDMSKQHNKQLEEWKIEESKEQEEKLNEQIDALKTNLEWNMQESKKQEDILKEQVNALETNLEWNIEESTKRESRLQEKITELQSMKEEDSLTIDTLYPPDDFLEQKMQLEKVKQQKIKIEEWLHKVVEESTKREKNLQQMIVGLESTTEASVCREELLKEKVTELESQIEELQTDNTRFGDLEKVLEAALEKEIQKQKSTFKKVADLKGSVKTTAEIHKSKQEHLLTRIFELESELAFSKAEVVDRKKITDNNEKLTKTMEAARKDKLYRDEIIANEDLSESVSALENQLEATEIEKLYRQQIIGDLQRDLEKVTRKNECHASRVFELENELESCRIEKFERNKRVAKVQSDMGDIAQKNEGLKGDVLELESELEYERNEKDDCTKQIAKLQKDLEKAARKQGPIAARNAELEKSVEASKLERESLTEQFAEVQNELETNTKFFESMKAYNHSLEIDQELAKTEQERLNKHIEELTNRLEESNSNTDKNSESSIQETHKTKTQPKRLSICIAELTDKFGELEDSDSDSINNNDEEHQQKQTVVVVPEIENKPEPERTEPTVHRNKQPITKVRNNVISELKTELIDRTRKAEIAELKEEFEKAEREFDKTVLMHEMQEIELSNRMNALETELEFGLHEHERLERIISVLRNELNMAAENHEPVAIRNRELEKALVSNKAEQDLRNKEVADLNDELQTTNKTFNNRVLELKMKLKSKHSEFEHLNEFKHELEAELEETMGRVQKIELEFEAAAMTMDRTYNEVSARNSQLEKKLISYKGENKYLNKMVKQLQNELSEKHGTKRQLKMMDSTTDFSSRSAHDELIESGRVNNHEELLESGRLERKQLIDDASEEEISMSEQIETSASEKPNAERELLDSKIVLIEAELEAERSKQKSLNKIIADLEGEKAEIDGGTNSLTKSTKVVTAKINECEAELEALSAFICELEADLEDLLDEIWDHDRYKEPDVQEHEQNLDDEGTESEDSFDKSRSMSKNNREHLSGRIVELEKEMEELEDELEDTIEDGKIEQDKLSRKNTELSRKLEVTIEYGKKEIQTLDSRNAELEKKLESTIEKGRKEQQTLAIHYIEKERELKQTAAKAKTEEKQLKSQITKLKQELESNRGMVTNEEGFLTASIADLVKDMDSNKNEQKLVSKHKEDEKQSHKSEQERLVGKVSELKQEFDSTVEKNQVLNETILEIEAKMRSAQETIQRAEIEVKDLNGKYALLETKWKNTDDDHETAIWEAEQKMRDLIETANVERREKIRHKNECSALNEDFQALQDENGKLFSQYESLAVTATEDKNGREPLVCRVAELEEEVRSISTKNGADQDRIHRITERAQNLQKELEMGKRKHEDLSSQIQSHEAEMKAQINLADRFSELQKELRSTIEKNNSEQQRHSELQQRLVESTMKNQADRANLDNRLRKLQMKLELTTKELESTRGKNERLSADLKFFESDKDELDNSDDIEDIDLDDEMRSSWEENADIIRKMESFERATSPQSLTSPATTFKTVTETTCFDEDEDTLTSDQGNSGSETSTNGSNPGRETSDSNHNSIVTTRATNRILAPAPLPLLSKDDDTDGIANPQTAPNVLQNQRIEDYLAPLVDRADDNLGQEIPYRIIQGIHNALLFRADEVECGNFTWEDFESILEEVCQEFDQDTWFDIQEAFFVAWEETEIQKIREDFEENSEDRDEAYDQ